MKVLISGHSTSYIRQIINSIYTDCSTLNSTAKIVYPCSNPQIFISSNISSLDSQVLQTSRESLFERELYDKLYKRKITVIARKRYISSRKVNYISMNIENNFYI